SPLRTCRYLTAPHGRLPLHSQKHHPTLRQLCHLGLRRPEKPQRIVKSGFNHFQTRLAGREILKQFRRNETYFPLYIPNTLSAPPTPVEKPYPVGICLRIIPINQTQQGRLSGAVGAQQRPAFPLSNLPVNP